MRVAFVVYDGMTALDFIGVYDPVIRLKSMGFMPDLQWDVCAVSQEISDSSGLRFLPTKAGEPLRSGLYLCEKLAARKAAEQIRQQMDYPLHCLSHFSGQHG